MALEELSATTLESRRAPGVFLCGEIVDVFARIGAPLPARAHLPPKCRRPGLRGCGAAGRRAARRRRAEPVLSSGTHSGTHSKTHIGTHIGTLAAARLAAACARCAVRGMRGERRCGAPAADEQSVGSAGRPRGGVRSGAGKGDVHPSWKAHANVLFGAGECREDDFCKC